MKKLLLILSILMLNSNVALAANNLVSADWWKTATLDKVKAEIVLVGKEEIIRNKVKEFYGKEIEEISDRLKIKNATETIEM